MKQFISHISFSWISHIAVWSVALSGCFIPACAHPLDSWHQRNPVPSPNNLFSVVHGNDRWIAVGAGGTVVSSADGTNWVKLPPPNNRDGIYFDIEFGNGNFVIPGYTNFFVSSDGISWRIEPLPQMPSPFPPTPTGCAFLNGQFYAFGYYGMILSSVNGAEWTMKNAPSESGPYEILEMSFGNGRYIALTGQSFLISDDGANWTSYSLAGWYLKDVVFRDGIFFALGGVTPFRNENDRIFQSQDGISWNEFSQLPAEGLRMIDTQFGLIVLPDDLNTDLMLSSDGQDWVQSPISENTYLTDASEYNGQLISVGQTFWDRSIIPAAAIFASRDGLAWERRDRGFHKLLDDVIYGGGKFVAVGGLFSTNAAVVVSTNGTDWTDVNIASTNRLRRVAYGNGTYVIIARENSRNPPTPIYTSTDALTWTKHDDTTNILTFLNAITYAVGKFVSVGFSNTVAYSNDGQVWQSQSLHDQDSLWSIAYGNGVFVAVGDKRPGTGPFNDNIITSTDGVSWTPQTTGLPVSRMRVVAFGNGKFVAIGDGNSFISTNGVNWEAHPFPFEVFTEKLVFGHGLFVMATRSSSSSQESFHNILSSPDGVNWTVRRTSSIQWLWAVAFGANSVVAIADSSSILQSDPFNPPPAILARYVSSTQNIELSLSFPTADPIQIQRSSNLGSPVWEPFGTLTTGSIILDSLDGPARFYRPVANE